MNRKPLIEVLPDNLALRCLEHETFGSTSQNQQADILDEVHKQQIHVYKHGQCGPGCHASNILENAWSCPISSQSRKDHQSGLKRICKFTRLPCPNEQDASCSSWSFPNCQKPRHDQKGAGSTDHKLQGGK